jgi:hypothetical protein
MRHWCQPSAGESSFKLGHNLPVSILFKDARHALDALQWVRGHISGAIRGLDVVACIAVYLL